MPRFGRSESEALQHAWNQFSLHAGQRMKMIDVFLVSLALVVAGYGTAMQGGFPVIALGVAVFGVVVVVAFLLLEVRNRELVKAAEAPLKVLEARLAAATDVPSLEYFARVEKSRYPLASYSKVIAILIAVSLMALVSGAAYAAVQVGVAAEQVDAPVDEHRPPPGDGHRDGDRR